MVTVVPGVLITEQSYVSEALPRRFDEFECLN